MGQKDTRGLPARAPERHDNPVEAFVVWAALLAIPAGFLLTALALAPQPIPAVILFALVAWPVALLVRRHRRRSVEDRTYRST
jgi:membrane protein implicated in regulation of membrane protease activity